MDGPIVGNRLRIRGKASETGIPGVDGGLRSVRCMGGDIGVIAIDQEAGEQQHVPDHEGGPERHLPFDRQVAEQEDHQSANRIERQDVAEPDEVIVDQPEAEQDEHPPCVNEPGRPAGSFGALDHQQHRGTE
nr:hypothetical protein [Sphingomonas daechungensis]